MIKQGNDIFETTRQEPKVDVCGKHYVFNANAKGHFDPRLPCPAYRMDDEIASLVSAKQQKDDREFAALAARNTPTVPFKTGVDGGMNKLFLAKLRADENRLTSSSPVFALGGEQHVPAMGNNVNPPRLPDAPSTTASVAAAAPAQEPRAVATSDAGAAHVLGSLLPNKWFGQGEAPTAQAQNRPAAQPPRSRPTAVAKAEPQHHPREARAAARPQVAERKQAAPQAPAAAPAPQTASAAPAPWPTAIPQQAPAPRTAGLMAGAAPVVSGTSFNSRWGEVH
jgi:hypothetical protein